MINIQNLMDNAKCFETVRDMRWPKGIICPKCNSSHVIKYGYDESQGERRKYHCKDCDKYFDDLTDTIFAGHISL